MGTPLITRVKLKLQLLARDLDPTEHRFRRVWPLIDGVEGFLEKAEAQWLFNAVLDLPNGSNVVEIGSTVSDLVDNVVTFRIFNFLVFKEHYQA